MKMNRIKTIGILSVVLMGLIGCKSISWTSYGSTAGHGRNKIKRSISPPDWILGKWTWSGTVTYKDHDEEVKSKEFFIFTKNDIYFQKINAINIRKILFSDVLKDESTVIQETKLDNAYSVEIITPKRLGELRVWYNFIRQDDRSILYGYKHKDGLESIKHNPTSILTKVE